MRTNTKLGIENLERREVFAGLAGLEGIAPVVDGPELEIHDGCRYCQCVTDSTVSNKAIDLDDDFWGFSGGLANDFADAPAEVIFQAMPEFMPEDGSALHDPFIGQRAVLPDLSDPGLADGLEPAASVDCGDVVVFRQGFLPGFHSDRPVGVAGVNASGNDESPPFRQEHNELFGNLGEVDAIQGGWGTDTLGMLGSGNIAQGSLRSDGYLLYRPLNGAAEYTVNGSVL